jgi:hypothetical protein
MKDPVISSQFLSENPEAARFHGLGLQAQLEGDYDEAHENLSEAASILGDTTSLAGQVQRARIRRDVGFTYVRQAVDDDSSKLVVAAEAMLDISLGDTKAAMLGEKFRELTGTEREGSTLAREIRREVLAEHGATLGLLGRTATVRAVLLGVDTRGNGDEARQARTEEQKWYGRDYAHGLLKQGNNGYYWVSNAMNGARKEIINGQQLRAGKWMVRATEGLAWTARHDRRNLAAAQKTFLGRLPYLRSYDAAKDSVLVKP